MKYIFLLLLCIALLYILSNNNNTTRSQNGKGYIMPTLTLRKNHVFWYHPDRSEHMMINNNITYDVTVTEDGRYYVINDKIKPVLTLKRNKIYSFKLDGITTQTHPFFFSTSKFGGGFFTYWGEYLDNVTGSRQEEGTITIRITNDTPKTLYYYCGAHHGMGNKIIIK